MKELYFITTSDEVKHHLKKFYASSEEDLKKYKNIKGDTEEKITSNFLGIDSCYLKLHNLNILKTSYSHMNLNKNGAVYKSFEKVLNKVYSRYWKCLERIKENLSLLADQLKPATYVTDEETLSSFLGETYKKERFIYPQGDKIVISTVFKNDNKTCIFSTCYSDSDGIVKYINKENTLKTIIPGKFLLGCEIKEVSESSLKTLFEGSQENSFENYIQFSNVENSNIKVYPKTDTNLKCLQESIVSSFKPVLKSSRIINGFIILSFNSELKRKDFHKVCSMLKLKSNDVYKFLAIQKEC